MRIINGVVDEQIYTTYINGVPQGGLSTAASWTIKTDNVGTSNDNQFTIPTTAAGTYDCRIWWGDGTSSKISAHGEAALTHTYPSAGTYNIEIIGTFYGIQFNNTGDKLKLLEISRWGGDFRLGNTGVYFYGCANLTIPATDTLDMTGTTTLINGFRSCSSLVTVPSFATLDTSSVIVFAGTFNGCTLFNQLLNNWDTSSATVMTEVFNGCSAYNQSISNWNTAKVTTMAYMLLNCAAFNQSLATFSVIALTTATAMLQGANALSTANYDATLISWAAQTLITAVAFHGGDATYSVGAATTAHDVLTDPPNSWTVTDGGQTP